MNLSTVIQAHPRRAHLAEGLSACFDGAAEIVWDPAPDTSVNPWRCYRHALSLTPPDADYRLIVQEDVIVCLGFLEAARAALAAKPDVPVCFYVGGHPHVHARPVREAAAAGDRFVPLNAQTWIPVVATAWPVRFIEPMLSWTEKQPWPPAFTADDEICGRYLQHVREIAWATVPSLVEHPDTEPSLVRRQITGGVDPSRRAAVWLEDLGYCDGREITWT